MIRTLALATAAALGLSATAHAQDPVDIGVIKNEDIRVVQKLLYPKEGRTEIGAHLGWMPFDAYLTTPNLGLSFDLHRNEALSFGGIIGGGYGLKTGTYKELESPTYGVAPDAYRYLASVFVGAQYAPIYAKLNLDGARVLHFDVYGTARIGGAFEQSVIPQGGFAFAPGLSLGIGNRFFFGERSAIRLEVRDDLLYERRPLTQTTHLKQNVNVSVGYTLMSPVKEKRR